MCDDGPCSHGFDCSRLGGRQVGKRSLYDHNRPLGVVCWYGSRCTQSDCRFLHPDGKPPRHPRSGVPNSSSVVSGPDHSMDSTTSNGASQSQHNSPRCSGSRPVLCRYGLACRHRSTCKFRHPGDKFCVDMTVTHSGRDISALGATVAREDYQSRQTAFDVSSAAEGDDADWQEQPKNADAEPWQQQRHNSYTQTTTTSDVHRQAGRACTWLAGQRPNMQRQCQQQPRGKACGEELQVVTVSQVGPALANHLRSRHGNELQGLCRRLSASRVLWLPGSSTLWASVPAHTAQTAHQTLLRVISAARTALSSYRLELPLIGGTRLLLLPGGSISHVLTQDVYITLRISDLPSTVSEEEIRGRLSSFGCINWLQVSHNNTRNTKEHQQAVMKAHPASRSSWARVMFEEPGQAAAALASAQQLLPWKVEACKPPPIKHTTSQGALRLRVTWQVGQRTDKIYVQLASAATASRVIKRCQQVYKRRFGLRYVLSINATLKAFVDTTRGSDRGLLLAPAPFDVDLKPPPCRPSIMVSTADGLLLKPIPIRVNMPCEEVLSEHAVRTCLIENCIIHPYDIVSITPQHVLGDATIERGRFCYPDRQSIMQQLQQELERMFEAHGRLRHVPLPGYNPQTGQASAFISYQDIEAYRKAMASLSGQSGPKPCKYGSDKPMAVNVEYCTTFPVDARTLSAVKPQLEAAIAKVRTRLPDVTVALLERPAATTGAVMVGLGNKQAVPKSPSSSRQSCSTVHTPDSECREGLVRLTGSSNEAVVAARALLEPAVATRVFDEARVGGVAALLTPAGKAFLLSLAGKHSQQTPAKHGATDPTVSAVHICWEQQLSRLRLYGPHRKLDQVEAAIMQYLQGSQQPKGKAIGLPSAAYQRIARGGRQALEALQQQSGAESIALDAVGKGLVVAGSSASIAAAETAAVGLDVCTHRDLQAIGKTAVEGGTKQETCQVCMCDVDEPYNLAGCGHSYCTGCLTTMLSSAVHNNNFPVKCCVEGCVSCICLSDLTNLLPAMELFAAYKAAFKAFVLANRDSWVAARQLIVPRCISKVWLASSVTAA